MKQLLGLVFAIGMMACGTEVSQEVKTTVAETLPAVKLPAALAKGLEAHGGLERWQNMEALQFAFQKDSVTEEFQQFNLKSRKTLITRGAVKVGYNGTDVWVTPNKEAFGKGSPKFYHSVYFYFFAMPFVLADPGIRYEEVAARDIDGKLCPGVKISYDAGVGDAPDDYYIAYFDPQTNLLHGLLYTVTYGDGKPNENFSALKYESWQKVNGILLPETIAWYKFENDTYGEKRREKVFTKVEVKKDKFAAELFEMK